jgi:tetratricopeptide (TPR) repeat protein
MRKCFSSAWGVALVAILGAGTVGCEQIGMLKGKMAYREANRLYSSANYEAAAEKYEEALEAGCTNGSCTPEELNYAYFFLANSYDNMYRPSRKGQPANDGYLTRAIELYREAAERSPNPEYRKRALQYMAAAHGTEKLNDPAKAEPIIQRLIELDPDDTTNYYQMSKLYEDAENFEAAEAQLVRARDVRPDDPDVYSQLARFYESRGDFDKQIEALKTRAEKDPSSPEAQYTIAVKYWERTCLPENRLCEAKAGGTARDKPGYIQAGLEASDKALAIREDYIDALVYKNLLLRSQTYLPSVPQARREELLKEADDLLEKVTEIQERRKTAPAEATAP